MGWLRQTQVNYFNFKVFKIILIVRDIDVLRSYISVYNFLPVQIVEGLQ